MRESELPKEAFELCKRLECGYCLTHDAPFTCCNRMKSLLTILKGKEWCELNIKYYEDREIMKPIEPKKEPRKQDAKDYIQGTLF